MQDDFSTRLIHALSNERLTGYQQCTKQSTLELFTHYAWNMALSESLYPALQTLEITLRNSIHNSVSQHYKCNQWFEDPKIISSQIDIKAVNKAKNTLKKQHKPLDYGRIIAELNFGFWTSLLDRRYEQVLWPQLLKSAFPHMPRHTRTRKKISQRFHKIRHLRNRVFHHEPIWHWKDLSKQHQDILEAISWIEPHAKTFVTALDRFDLIHQTGPNILRQKLEKPHQL